MTPIAITPLTAAPHENRYRMIWRLSPQFRNFCQEKIASIALFAADFFIVFPETMGYIITPAIIYLNVVIPTKAGIQNWTGCRIKSGMTFDMLN